MQKIHKKIGETPLEALKRFRANNPEYEEARLSYAGRLDPMAEGELLILEGDENESREEYLARDKVYEFKILFGVSTDTFDLLGLVEDIETEEKLSLTINKVQTVLDKFAGEWEMRYPPYSSKTVTIDDKKVPLWRLARADKLPKRLPTKEVEIYDLKCSDLESVSTDYIIDYIIDYISRVNGDFRQGKIIDRWQKILDVNQKFLLATCSVTCSSGTYVRRLANEIGGELNTPALAFSIKRMDV